MKQIKKHLEKLRKIERRQYHPIIYKIHKKHKISKKTLFYIKEYGPHSNVPKIIIKESIGILLLASIISSLGGFGLEYIKSNFIKIMPFIILLPILNDMIGDYGTIISSKFSTMLHEGKIKQKWWKNTEVKKILQEIIIISFITAIFSALLAIITSDLSSYIFGINIIAKILFISIIDTILLVIILFFMAIYAGLYFFRKKEDPNNFLIPITTSIADFCNMIILAILIFLFF
ncbi:MAG: magnesium transporter [Candidatus Aenigmatarchaeota archaeon]